jgi:hypothetical protein
MIDQGRRTKDAAQRPDAFSRAFHCMSRPCRHSADKWAGPAVQPYHDHEVERERFSMIDQGRRTAAQPQTKDAPKAQDRENFEFWILDFGF